MKKNYFNYCNENGCSYCHYKNCCCYSGNTFVTGITWFLLILFVLKGM